MAHHCHATGCEATVPPEMFMCRGHWKSLPRPMQVRIWAAYRPGQCDDWNITTEYADAAREAVTYVAKKEGREPDTDIYDVLDPKSGLKPLVDAVRSVFSNPEGVSMPPQTKKSSLGSSLKAHAKDPVDYGMDFTPLPAGVKGVARLVEAKRGQFKTGTNQGKDFLYLAGVVVSPRTAIRITKVWDPQTKKVIIVGTPQEEVIEGQRTTCDGGPLPLCETKKKDGTEVSQDENVANALNELRKLAGEGSTDHITDEAELDAFLVSLKEAGPYFKFSTSAGEPTAQYPEQRLWENWYGTKGLEDYVPEEVAAVQDKTPVPQNGVHVKPGRPIGKQAEAPAPVEYTDDQDLDSLAAKADEGDEKAQERLTEAANKAGVTDDQIASVENWGEVVALMTGGAGEGTETEAEWEPAKEEVYYYKPQVKGPGGKMTTAKKSVECEVTAVDAKKKTVALKNLTDNKVYKDVPWGDLTQEA